MRTVGRDENKERETEWKEGESDEWTALPSPRHSRSVAHSLRSLTPYRFAPRKEVSGRNRETKSRSGEWVTGTRGENDRSPLTHISSLASVVSHIVPHPFLSRVSPHLRLGSSLTRREWPEGMRWGRGMRDAGRERGEQGTREPSDRPSHRLVVSPLPTVGFPSLRRNRRWRMWGERNPMEAAYFVHPFFLCSWPSNKPLPITLLPAVWFGLSSFVLHLPFGPRVMNERTGWRADTRPNRDQTVTKGLSSSSKFSGSCVPTLQTLPWLVPSTGW